MRRWACAMAMLLTGAAMPVPNFIDASAGLPVKPGQGHSMNVVVADVDGDRIDDLVIAMERDPNRLLLGDGKGGFRDASDRLPRAARDSEESAVADLDGDGDLDIAVANEDDLLPELYLNDGRGRFTDASERIRHRVKANAVTAFDADGDKRPDLFFGGDKVSSLWMGMGKGRFRDESVARLPATYGGTQDVSAGDLDGDGDPDLVLGNEDRNQIYLNDGRGLFALAPAEVLPRPAAGPEETRDALLFDADGDGDADLFFANTKLWNPNAVAQNRLLLNDGKGRFVDATDRLPQRRENSIAALAIDLDGDGRLDLVTVGVAADLRGADPTGPVRILLNRGARFEDVSEVWLPPTAVARGFDVAAVDANRDGKMDLFVAGRGGRDLLLIRR
ncbi:FG-GAP repeat domain-containing protein [Sandaracinobacteroides saxicola]|uniref:VCBS repeat-containing protein n=1 Tax=Sandaracinobacteroides saxicola TaxID=2759707 RepID=A0A7G5IH75_9SPHN|nr:VCBS repeat-containing protein [Sandaracinobacteroides saxicola]QMW22717.1 VCBS repeat-containing protein [Sandaracinobacteroides saxicola]